jgi:hemolysin III
VLNAVDHFRDLPSPVESSGEKWANIISHGIGFVAALIGAPILILAVLDRGSAGFFVGTIVFTITMSILYLSSTLYHAWPSARGKSLWRVIDHSAIFLLIAGTYTPFGLGPLRASGGLIMLSVVWALAIFGVAMKATRGTLRHPKLSMSLYLGTGWLGLVVIRPLSSAIPLSALLWLLAGGIAYTAGTLFFVNQRVGYSHFIWHLFVLAGTSCHFIAVISCAA